MQNKNGSALIVALMVTLIIIITASGMIFIASAQNKAINTEVVNTRTFYAADAGLVQAIKVLRNVTYAQFATPSASAEAIITGAQDFELNGCVVDLTSSWENNNTWTLTSKATDKITGNICEATMANIRPQSIAEYTSAIEEDMPPSVVYAGKDPDSGVYEASDMMLGNLFFGGLINIIRDPVFDGNVVSSASKKSIRNIFNVYDEDANTNAEGTGLTDIQRAMFANQYNNGIWDKSVLSENVEDMKPRYRKIFPNGYEGNSGEIDNTQDVVASFAEILNPTTRPSAVKNPYIIDIEASDDIKITFGDGWVKVDPKPQNWQYSNKPFGDGHSRNAILIRGASTEINRVAIMESTISGNITLMTEHADIEILGDIKYKKLIPLYNSAINSCGSVNVGNWWAPNYVDAIYPWANNAQNIKDLGLALQNSNSTSNFGCIAENGNVWLGKELLFDWADIYGVTLLSGTFYAPNGKFGARDITDNGATEFGTINDWFKPNDKSVLTRIVVLGSALMKSIGMYRNSDNTRGFEGTFCNDYRQSVDGLFPAAFKPLRTSDGWIFNEDLTRWSYSYTSNCNN